MIDRGTYKIIRADGTETLVMQKPTIDALNAAIGCTRLDSVTLSQDPAIMMMVDDTGMIDGKPVNAKATELYHQKAPNSAFSIHGDVVLVNDEDFE